MNALQIAIQVSGTMVAIILALSALLIWGIHSNWVKGLKLATIPALICCVVIKLLYFR